MRVDKISISFGHELGEAVRVAAANAGKLRSEALAAFLAGWQAEHGAISSAELAKAEAELGLASASPAA